MKNVLFVILLALAKNVHAQNLNYQMGFGLTKAKQIIYNTDSDDYGKLKSGFSHGWNLGLAFPAKKNSDYVLFAQYQKYNIKVFAQDKFSYINSTISLNESNETEDRYLRFRTLFFGLGRNFHLEKSNITLTPSFHWGNAAVSKNNGYSTVVYSNSSSSIQSLRRTLHFEGNFNSRIISNIFMLNLQGTYPIKSWRVSLNINWTKTKHLTYAYFNKISYKDGETTSYDYSGKLNLNSIIFSVGILKSL